jgi:photosystem II stability/assembly factor-like uncharacterized protein
MPPTTPLRVALALAVVLGAGLARRPDAGGAAPARPSGVLLLGAGNGVYRSADWGRSWQPAGSNLPAGGVWQVQADPSLPYAAYVTTGSLFRTTDAGRHWAPVPGGGSGGPGFTALTAQGALVLAAGTDGIVAEGGGQRWVPEHLPPPGGSAPRRLVAAGTDLLYAVGADGRLYLHGNVSWRAPNTTWQALYGGLPDGPITAFTYVPFTARPDYACATTDPCAELFAAVAGHGLWQSIDSGHTWTQETHEHDALPPTATIRALLVSGSDQAVVYAAVDGRGLYRSQYAGQFWKPAEGERGHPAITALAEAGGMLVAATAGSGVALYQEKTGAVAWQGWATGIPAGTLGLSLAWLPAPTSPLTPAPALAGPCEHRGAYPVCGPFLRFYLSANPALLMFGNSVSPLEYDTLDKHLIVQYFERARFEYRPDLPGGVRLTPLGRLLSGGVLLPRTPAPGTALVRPVLFPQTGYSVGEPFLSFWRKHQGARFLGYPISSLVLGQNDDGSGRIYVMQYFENARLEYHPEIPDAHFRIEPGILGKIYLCRRLHIDQYCST